MSGQTMSYEEKVKIMDEYLEKYNPCKPLEPLQFDLHGYCEYISEHNIPSDQIDESIWSMFRK